MRRPHHHHYYRCFTLVEVLTVVILLGMLAGYTLRNVLLQPVSPKQMLQQFAAIDAEARLVARRYGPVILTLESNQESGVTEVNLVRDGLERSYSIKLLVRAESEGRVVDVLAFDRHGQSVDYDITITDTKDQLRVAGLTGWSWFNREAGDL